MTAGVLRSRSEGDRRLVYLTDAQIPGRSAPGIQVVRMCDAFTALGVEVTLIAPQFRLSANDEMDVKTFYGLRHDFTIRRHPIPIDMRLWNRHKTLLAARLLSHGSSVAAEVLKRPPDWFYGRSQLGLWMATGLRHLRGRRRIPVYAEMHDLPTNATVRKLFGRLDGVVAISKALGDAVIRKGIVAADSIRVEPNGFDAATERTEAASAPGLLIDRWRIDPTKPLLVYVGRVDAAKGVGTLLKLGKRLPSVEILIVGEVWEKALLERATGIANVHFAGHVPPAEVCAYLDHATILLLPSTSALSYAAFMSPLKLLEYMGAAKPIIASDLPAIRELLVDNENALLVQPENVEAWVSAVRRLLAEPTLGATLGSNARRDAKELSWDKRASRILSWLSRRSHEHSAP